MRLKFDMWVLPIWAVNVFAAFIAAAAIGVAADPDNPAGMAASHQSTEQRGQSGQRLKNPPEIASKDGVLSATLTVGPAELTVAGQNVAFPALYNGLYTPPVLRVQPGDTVKLLLNNFAQLPTNLHYHGFNVTPRKRGDNIFLSIDQGDSFRYNFPIPAQPDRAFTGIIPSRSVAERTDRGGNGRRDYHRRCSRAVSLAEADSRAGHAA